MALLFSDLQQLHKTHPAWRLLRAERAPLILSFLDKVFIEPNVRVMSQSDLESKLEDTLYFLRQGESDGSYSRNSREYLDDWASDEKGFLRKFYPPSSDEVHYDLTPGTEKAISWIKSLTASSFIGTESKLRTIFEILKEMVIGAETDVQTRIAELQKKRDDLDAQILAIQNGEMPVMDETALRERFMQFSGMARDLLGDFREVEHNFRQLDIRVREKIATWDGSKGDLLEQIFGERDVITDSDQGRSFRAFWDFLMSSRSQEEFTTLLEKVFLMQALSEIATDRRLKRVHFDWLEAGEHTQRTVAGLSQQLRRYLDNQAYLENKRIMQILDNITQHALAVKHSAPAGMFTTLDDCAPDIRLPMDRPLYTPAMQPVIDSLVNIADQDGINLDALFEQVYIDKELLMDYINRELRLSEKVSLGSIVEKYPLSKGLAELITYISIACNNTHVIVDETREEMISWIDRYGMHKKAFIPKIIFNRM